ncbi:MAG: hypothetical protein KAT62_13925 [Desulfuromonadales bacterium]|nr:hypothetical protein [Desulfuromonadales bacterium]
MAKKHPTQKYVVSQPGTLKFSVGDIVDLTDSQAAGLVNKVRLKDDVEAESSAAKPGAAAKLKKDIDALTAKVAELEAANEAVAKERDALTAKVAELEAAAAAK